MTDLSATTPEREAQAAEYVLGLLTAEEVADFQSHMSEDPGLVAEVRRWQTYFASMADLDVEPVAPPARLFAKIQTRLFGPMETAQPGLLDRLAFWRGLSVATTALASLALAFAVLPSLQQPLAPGQVPEVAPADAPEDVAPEGAPADVAPEGAPDVAPEGVPANVASEGIPAGTILMTHLIPTEGSDLGLAVTREPSGVLQVRRVAGAAPDGRAQELWVIAGDNAPVSLGLLSADALTTITPDAATAELFAAGAALAISDEPQGGSPTGAPTGDILALGSLVAL